MQAIMGPDPEEKVQQKEPTKWVDVLFTSRFQLTDPILWQGKLNYPTMENVLLLQLKKPA
jgi:hypothetical protein